MQARSWGRPRPDDAPQRSMPPMVEEEPLSSAIEKVQLRFKDKKHEGKVIFLARNHKLMKVVFPSGETEDVEVSPRVRIAPEVSLGCTVRMQAPDHLTVLWSKAPEGEESKKPRVKRTHATFDMDLLKSQKGLPVILDKFPKIKFKGPGHEAADLRKLMDCYKDWASELYPKFSFHHTVRKLELMGSSRDAKLYMSEARLDYQVRKQDEAKKRSLEQLAANRNGEPWNDIPEEPQHLSELSSGVTLDDAKRRRMEENKQKALARLAARKQLQPEQPAAFVNLEEDDVDIDRAIADQDELAEM